MATKARKLSGADQKLRTNQLLVGTDQFLPGQNDKEITPTIVNSSRNSTASRAHAQFHNPNGLVGAINTDGSATIYGTSSDYRLKENVQPMTGALAKVAQLKPCTYTWKAGGKPGEGFIAHELQAVCPQAVIGEKDGVDEDGKPQYQAIDSSFLVAMLVASIQELNAKVEAQAAEIAALKSA